LGGGTPWLSFVGSFVGNFVGNFVELFGVVSAVRFQVDKVSDKASDEGGNVWTAETRLRFSYTQRSGWRASVEDGCVGGDEAA